MNDQHPPGWEVNQVPINMHICLIIQIATWPLGTNEQLL